jgi:uncharacterized lipoprotein
MLRVLALAMALLAVGCSPSHLRSFSALPDATWTSIELRDGVTYDHAWETLVSRLVQDFDVVVLSKEDGYIQTDWLYSWTGVYEPDYRVRVKVKCSREDSVLKVKSEAQTKAGNRWVTGVDARLVSTIKNDILGTLGRASR